MRHMFQKEFAQADRNRKKLDAKKKTNTPEFNACRILVANKYLDYQIFVLETLKGQHTLLSHTRTVTSCRMFGCGPFSLRLPHPTTVAVCPARSGPPNAARQTGLTLGISGTSSSRVITATSLCRVC